MAESGSPGGRRRSEAVGAVGLALFAVSCCAAVPLVAAIASGVAVGAILGVGAGALAAGGVVALVVARSRRGRYCEVEGARAPAARANGAGARRADADDPISIRPPSGAER